MSVAVWPDELPSPTRAGWQSQYADPRMARTSDVGPPGFRRRYSSTARNVSLTLELTLLQRAVFNDLLTEGTSHGSLPFWMPDPSLDGAPLLTADDDAIRSVDDDEILIDVRWLCLFGQDLPVETLEREKYVLQFSVWVMP